MTVSTTAAWRTYLGLYDKRGKQHYTDREPIVRHLLSAACGMLAHAAHWVEPTDTDLRCKTCVANLGNRQEAR